MTASRNAKRTAFFAILAVTIYTSFFGIGTGRLALPTNLIVLMLELVCLLVVWMLPTAYDASHLKGGSRFSKTLAPRSDDSHEGESGPNRMTQN